MSQENARTEVVRKISNKMGFSFKEEELSPKLRKEIRDFAEQQTNLWYLNNTKQRFEENVSSTTKYLLGAFILGTVLFLLSLLLFRLGIFNVGSFGFLLFALFAFSLSGLLFMKREAYTTFLGKAESEISVVSSKLEKDISAFSDLVYSELSKIHEARVRPLVRHVTVNFAEIIQAARGKGIILETIECPHCAAPIPLPKTGESFQCKHCGKTVHATNVFEALKDLLKTD